MDRSKIIVRTSVIGIVANIFLASFKAVVGLFANSIAIIMDAVNNLSDALSSVITIVGTKLSEKPANRSHPFGHGRIEYFSAIIISVIVLVAGISSLIESVKKIFNPTTPDYTTSTLAIIIMAIVVKLLLGRYVKKVGNEVNSDALVASGADALFDAVKEKLTIYPMSWDVIKGENRFSGGGSVPKERKAFLRSVRNEGYDVAVKTMLNPLRDWKRLVYYNLPSFVRKKLTG